MGSDGFVYRGVRLPFWLSQWLTDAARERGVSVNRVMNDSIVKGLGVQLSPEDAEKFKVRVEIQRLLDENQYLFFLMSRVKRDGVYVPQAAKDDFYGSENVYGRWQAKAEGIVLRASPEELDVLNRAYALREKNTAQIVALMDKLLPRDKLDIKIVEDGWRVSGKSRRGKQKRKLKTEPKPLSEPKSGGIASDEHLEWKRSKPVTYEEWRREREGDQ